MALFIGASTQYNLPPGLLASLCYVESKHQVNKIHYNDGDTNSYGVCQIKLITAQEMGFKGTAIELMTPKTNIQYAGAYLKYQLTRYNGNVARAVVAYNKGNSRHLTSSPYQIKVFREWRLAQYDVYNSSGH